MLSGVCPGVSMTRRTSRPTRILVAVLHGSMGEGRACLLAHHERGARALGQLAMTAHKVGVKVGCDHPPDREPEGGRLLEVLLDVTPWVDHHSLTLGADQVGGLGQATQVELLEVHESLGFRLP